MISLQTLLYIHVSYWSLCSHARLLHVGLGLVLLYTEHVNVYIDTAEYVLIPVSPII